MPYVNPNTPILPPQSRVHKLEDFTVTGGIEIRKTRNGGMRDKVRKLLAQGVERYIIADRLGITREAVRKHANAILEREKTKC